MSIKFGNSTSDKCLTMWHQNYPLHVIYVSTLPRKVTGVKIVTKQCDSTLLLAKTGGLRQQQVSLCSRHIICLHCY